ncbi:MAG: glycosyltransferase [Thermoplasmata archaeon]|nr:glycosyltransferase [Thermoplasmata archaeon]
MRVAWVYRVSPIIKLRDREVELFSDPPNFFWEIREALGFAKLGHEVILVSTPNLSRKVDLVFCASDTQGDIAYRIAGSQDVPFVYQQISATPEYEDEVWRGIKHYMKLSDAITCVSKAVYRGVKKWAESENYKGLIEIVPHGVDTDLIDRIPESERKHFVYCGALFKHKRVDWLIRASARTELPLVIIGDGPERAELEALAMIYHAPVKFAGVVSEEEKYRILKSSKAVLHASEGEQFFIPAAEGLACNCHVICYKLQNIIDTYGDHLVYFETFEELCDLMKKYWETHGNPEGRLAVEELGLTMNKRSQKLQEVFRKVRR